MTKSREPRRHPSKRLRCAVYTRKSSDEGLEQSFNSLDAQREACAAFVLSQKHEGWTVSPAHYDDGGYSGGTLDRPALQRLLADIADGKVDVVVVYKIDRLTRSLFDFAKIVEAFDASGVSFVSITQQFNTTTSMGRLTLNVLLSFAQFEREVAGERIRDKIAASKQKGMWMGGLPPLGYAVADRRLVVIEREAVLVRRIFDRFAKTGSALTVARELNAAGEVTKRRMGADGARGGKPWTKGAVYKVLANRVFLGEAVHKGVAYPGEHAAIVDRRAWDKAHAVMAAPARQRAAASRAQVPALLKGLIFGPNGRPLSPSHTRRRGRVYRYYVAREAIADGYGSCAVTSVPAADVEGAVLDHVQKLLAAPELVARTWATVKRDGEDAITEREVTVLLAEFAMVWNELFPAEQARIVQLLVERVDVEEDALEVLLTEAERRLEPNQLLAWAYTQAEPLARMPRRVGQLRVRRIDRAPGIGASGASVATTMMIEPCSCAWRRSSAPARPPLGASGISFPTGAPATRSSLRRP